MIIAAEGWEQNNKRPDQTATRNLTTMIEENVPYYTLTYHGQSLTIRKDKWRMLGRAAFFLMLMGLVLCWVVSGLEVKSTGLFKKDIDAGGWLLLIVFSGWFVLYLYFSIVRFRRMLADVEYFNGDKPTLNGKELFDSSQRKLIIQDVAGGVGGSKSIGIEKDGKFFGFCFNLSDLEARKISAFIVENLGWTMEEREAVFFPLFSLH